MSTKDSRRCDCGHYRGNHSIEKDEWYETFAYGSMHQFRNVRTGSCFMCPCTGYHYKEGALETRDNPGVRTPELSA